MNDVFVLETFNQIYLRLNTDSLGPRKLSKIDNIPRYLSSSFIINSFIDNFVSSPSQLISKSVESPFRRDFYDETSVAFVRVFIVFFIFFVIIFTLFFKISLVDIIVTSLRFLRLFFLLILLILILVTRMWVFCGRLRMPSNVIIWAVSFRKIIVWMRIAYDLTWIWDITL